MLCLRMCALKWLLKFLYPQTSTHYFCINLGQPNSSLHRNQTYSDHKECIQLMCGRELREPPCPTYFGVSRRVHFVGYIRVPGFWPTSISRYHCLADKRKIWWVVQTYPKAICTPVAARSSAENDPYQKGERRSIPFSDSGDESRPGSQICGTYGTYLIWPVLDPQPSHGFRALNVTTDCFLQWNITFGGKQFWPMPMV